MHFKELILNLVKEKNNIVTEQYIYTRSAATILNDKNDIKITGLTKKGEKLEVIGYDYLNDEGEVNLYQIKTKETTGYVYGKYMTITEEESMKNYNTETYDKIHGNSFHI